MTKFLSALAAIAFVMLSSQAFACGVQITDPFPCALAPTPEEVATGHYVHGHWSVQAYRAWNARQEAEFNARMHRRRFAYARRPMMRPRPMFRRPIRCLIVRNAFGRMFRVCR